MVRMQNSLNFNNKPIPPPVPPRPDKLNRKKKHPPAVVESKDLRNHELLINELQHNNKGNNYSNLNNCTINHSNWYEVGDNGNEVQYSRCQIIIDNTSGNNNNSGHGQLKSTPPPLPPKNSARKELMLLNGLPPLPKCLNSFNGGSSSLKSSRGFRQNAKSTNTDTFSSNNGTYNYNSSSLSSISSTSSSSDLGTMISGSNSTPISRSPSLAGLNEKFAFLKKEMTCLRQLDLSLLSQLWTLNESIQEFRTLLMDQDQELLQNIDSTKVSDYDEDDIYQV